MQIQEIVVRMTGSEGFQNIDVPSHFMDEYQFVTLINLTDNHMLLFPKGVTVRIPGNEIVTLAQYSSITLPIMPDMKLGLVATWINLLETQLTEIKLGKLIFSIENLNFGASFAPSHQNKQLRQIIHRIHLNQNFTVILPPKTKKLTVFLEKQATLTTRSWGVSFDSNLPLWITSSIAYTLDNMYILHRNLNIFSPTFPHGEPIPIVNIEIWTEV